MADPVNQVVRFAGEIKPRGLIKKKDPASGTCTLIPSLSNIFQIRQVFKDRNCRFQYENIPNDRDLSSTIAKLL